MMSNIQRLRRTLLLGALGAATALSLPQAAVAKEIVVQINSSLPQGSFAHVFLLEYKKRVEAALGNSVNIQIFMGNTLGSEEDVLQGLRLGTHHASLSASAVVQINPRAAVFDLPYLFKDRTNVKTFINSDAGKMLAQGFDGKGMKLAALWDNGFRVITNSSRPIVKPEDLKGLKIRTPTSRQRVAMFNQLGANATPLAFGELYSALNQKVVDGQENPAQIVESAKLFEVQRFMSISNHVYLPTFLLFGDPFMSTLPTNTRNTLLKVTNDMTEWTLNWGDETDSKVLASLKDKIAINQVDFPAFQVASAPLYKSPIFVNAIGSEMIDATRKALNIN